MKSVIIGGKDYDYTITLTADLIEFKGRFLPSNSRDFFVPITNWFTEYTQKPSKETIINFKLDYFNTSTSKKFLDLMMLLEETKNTKTIINWYYNDGDEDILDAGKGYSELVNIEFNFITY